MKLREFNLADLHHICKNLPEDEREVWEAMTGEPYQPDEATTMAFKFPGMHWIVVTEEGIPLAAGGFIRQRRGVFRTWFFAVPSAWDHGADLTALVKGVIQQLLNEGLAHRVETVTLLSRRRARKWYEQLDLKEESTLRGYTVTGEDAVMYVATRNVENV